MPETEYRLHYWISNNGDGSAAVRITETAEEAEHEDENQYEGWGEPCNSYKTIVIRDGKPYVKTWHDNPVTDKYEEIYIPLEEVTS